MRNWKMNAKLTVMFLLVGLTPVLIASIYLFVGFSAQVEKQKMLEIQGRNESKKFQIEQWYREITTDLEVLSSSEDYAHLLERFEAVCAEGVSDAACEELRAAANASTSLYCNAYGYDDLTLINPAGEPVFSSHYDLTKFVGFNMGGQASASWSAQVRETLSGKVTGSDLHPYGHHEAEELKMYFMAPLRRDGQVIGIVALGVHAELLDKFMTASAGMGRSGESFIVGSDRLLRSKLRGDVNAAVLEAQIDTPNVALAFEGKTGVGAEINDNGEVVYSAYTKLDLPDLNWAVMTRMDRDEAEGNIPHMRFMMESLLIVLTIIFTAVAVLLSRSISRPLRTLTAIAQRMAEGELEHEMPHDTDRKDELGQLAAAFEALMKTNQTLVASVAAVAEGTLDAVVPLRGEHDLLAQSVNHMIDALRKTAAQAESIAQGDLGCKTAVRSENDQLGLAIERMKSALRADREENARQHWLQSGILRISAVLAGQDDTRVLASNCITALCKWIGASVGCFYIRENQGDGCAFVLLGSYAYTERRNLSNRFALGEGLVGQAALEGQPILLQQVPDDYVRVTSGLGESTPRNICVTPLLFENEVLGVVEIGTIEPLGEKEQLFLERVAGSVAVALEVARNRTVLKAHQEELQASNRELQAQAAELERSEQELLAQQRSLEETNEELKVQMSLVSQSEDRLRAQQQELESVNIELTRKNDQLRRRGQEIEEARKALAEQAEGLRMTSQYKSEFMANMSHELRTPLNSLLILARTLQENGDGNLTEEQVECATIIHDSGKDLLELINDILDLSKIEAGQMRLTTTEVEVEEICQNLSAQFNHVAREKGLSFTVLRADDAPVHIITDSQRLGQILKNLVGNALKFTHEGGVTVTFGRPEIETEFNSESLSGSPCLAVHVCDTGIGIAEEMLHKVFGAFQQVDSGDSRNYGGTGLGLSISQEIAQLLGGEIQVRSSLGKGSTFSLYLPTERSTSAAPSPAEDDKTPAGPHGEDREKAVDGDMAVAGFPDDRDLISKSSQVILLIEDDRSFVGILQDHVRKRGFHSLVALSGEEGLKLAQSFLPAGILLDIQLPGMDGWAVLSHLKRDEATRHIPVHIISATEASSRGLGEGAIGHTIKPISLGQLRDVLDQLEMVISEKEKHVLIVEDNDIIRQETVKLIDHACIRMTQVKTGQDAAVALRKGEHDLLILDLGLPDMQGMELLDMLSAEGVKLPPVIVYTGRELTIEEEKALRDHTASIIIKDVRSQERLLDEVALFLHHVITDLPLERREAVRHMHDTDKMMHGKVVLLVEDDMRTLFAMSKLLSEHGVITLKAENGQKAIELLLQSPQVDMVLMDMMMPVMDGYEAMRRIRGHEQYATLPIIALTAKAMAEDRAKCVGAGASDYLTKPIEPGKLLSLMRVWMEA